MNRKQLKLSSKLSRPQLIRIATGLAVATLLGLGIYIAYLFGLFGSVADVTAPAPITNQATVQFCTAGDASTICNPTANTYSGSAQSNVVTTQIITASPAVSPAATPSVALSLPPAPSQVPLTSPPASPVATPPATTVSDPLRLQILLSDRKTTQYNHGNISIEILDSANRVVHSFTGLSSDGSGNITLKRTDVASLASNNRYRIVLKAPGFRWMEISTTSVFGQTLAATLPCCDANGNGTLGLDDVVGVIRAFNGRTTASEQLVLAALGRKPTLPDLVTTIRNFNQYH